MGNKRSSGKEAGAKSKKSQGQQAKRGGFLAGPRKFTRDVQGELKRVNWPDREQLKQSTAVVLVIVVTLGVYVAAWDFVFQALARLVFSS